MCIFIFVYICIYIYLDTGSSGFHVHRFLFDKIMIWQPLKTIAGISWLWSSNGLGKETSKRVEVVAGGSNFSPVILMEEILQISCSTCHICEILWNMGIFSISTGFLAGFLNHQQYGLGSFGFLNDRIGIMAAWGWYFPQADGPSGSQGFPIAKRPNEGISNNEWRKHTLGFRAGGVFLLFCELSNVDTVGVFSWCSGTFLELRSLR